MTKAIAYAAKSSEDRHGSIGTQLADCRHLAEREGWTVAGEYIDEAASGYSGSRGASLVAAWEHAARIAADDGHCLLIAQHSDRFARGDGRSAAHLVEYVIKGRRCGVELRTVQDDGFADDLVRAVLQGERAHEDSRRKGLATSAGLRRAAERGEWAGGHCPDGYQILRSVDGNGRVARRMRRDPERGPIIARVFELALVGWSRRAIAVELDRSGYRTQAGRTIDAHRIGQILSLPAYAGRVIYRGEVLPDVVGQWPRFIEPSDFDRLSASVKRRPPNPKAGRPPAGLLAGGLARCGHCGGPMDAASGGKRSDGQRRRSYTCRAHRQLPGDHPSYCEAKPFNGQAVDGAVLSNLDTMLADVSGWADRLQGARSADVARLNGEVDRAHADVAEADRLVAKMGQRYDKALSAGDDDRADAIEEAMSARRAERKRAETRLAACEAAVASAEAQPEGEGLTSFYAAVAAELSGRMADAAGDMRRLNLALADYFDGIALTHTDDGVKVTPMLSDEAALRILRNPAAARITATVGGESARVVAATGAHEGAEVWLEVRVPADHPLARGDAVNVAIEGRSLVASTQTRDEVGNPPSRS